MLLCVSIPVRSQGEARKPELQHHMGLDARNTDFVACEQQRPQTRYQTAHLRSLISAFVIHYLENKVARSDIS